MRGQEACHSKVPTPLAYCFFEYSPQDVRPSQKMRRCRPRRQARWIRKVRVPIGLTAPRWRRRSCSSRPGYVRSIPRMTLVSILVLSDEETQGLSLVIGYRFSNLRMDPSLKSAPARDDGLAMEVWDGIGAWATGVTREEN